MSNLIDNCRSVNQMLNAGQEVVLPDKGGFVADDIHIEVGERNKTGQQVQDVEYSIIAADDIEVGYGNKIPLWLFGFLY